MALTGQAKVDYQREYMRRRRAGEPKPPWQPSKLLIYEIERLVWLREHQPSSLRALDAEVIKDLHFDTPEEMMEACYRHRDITKLQRQERIAEEERAKKPRPVCCSFCGEPLCATRSLFGDRFTAICEPCCTEAAKVFTDRKARQP